ncbi:Outer membrane efflux protein [Cardinium endosymbiont of Sogatella furcifera]|uniref:TolC family protein n=1 Tax=Cardinium endosymbiont of Sogatella furcifera TaxID=650378 RepID=UPI000E0D56A3|nr:TolC family protein [Cardinium endosymbiont of Sogatella furcifera]AXI24229.1 Outer membrane efflux protein [Cardinium endosymbiont of Sogatella furcifera]
MRLIMKKWVVRFSLIGSIAFLGHHSTEAKSKPISLQEAINMALKDNLNIQIAAQTKKKAILSRKIDAFQIWLPQATCMLAYENSWLGSTQSSAQQNGAKTNAMQSHMRSKPVFTLQWELASLADKIFQTKIHHQNNVIYKLDAKKSIAKELQRVVMAYYKLALAQKKWKLSKNLIKLATARLKIEEEKLKVGRISKIDCLDAQLALKQVKLSLLERQEALKGKRRNLNVLLGKPLNEEIWVHPTISVQPIWDIQAVTKEKMVDLKVAIQEKKVAIAATELRRAKAHPLSCLNLLACFQSKGYTYNFEDEPFAFDATPSKWFGSIGIQIDIATLLLMPAKIKKAKIALHNATFALKQQKLALEDGLEDKKWQYHHALDAHSVAEEQLKISKQKLVFIREKYRLKQVKLLELREAEEATQKAEIDVVEHALKVKHAEFALYQLVGMFHQKLS